MGTQIHPTAIIEPGAELGEGVKVGAYAIIGPNVRIGDGTVVRHHATLEGFTELGNENIIYPYSFIGAKTHDLKFEGGQPGLKIGSRNTFREYVTVHAATNDGEHTVVGNENVVLAYSHIAHDCQIGDDVILVNHVSLGGHVVVEDAAIIGGLSGVHQFCRIGRHAMVGAHSMIVRDVLPYTTVTGPRAHLAGLNLVGLKRHGFDNDVRRQLQDILDALFAEPGTTEQRLEEIRRLNGFTSDGPAQNLITFLTQATKGRGFTGPLE